VLWVLDQLFDGELVENAVCTASGLAHPGGPGGSRSHASLSAIVSPVTLHSPLEANYTRSWVEKHSGLQLADSDEHAS
jgi:hypothetical protein